MAYSIAAYAIVVATLVAYGGWVQSQRRQLMREARSDPGDEREG